ncbi:MAG: TldD/PmbA family protein [Desulfarculus sp.]|nr:TldD/PmbA family protein [Desulfarculus sp.]
MMAEHAGQVDLSRRSFLLAATAATVAGPVLLGLGCQSLASGQATSAAPPAPHLEYFEGAFGITAGDLDRVLREALGGGGDYSDLYFQHSQGTWIVMEDGKVNRAFTSVSLGMGVRVLKREQTGYAFSQELSLPAMLEAAKAAASLANGGGQAPGARGLEARPLKRQPRLDLYPQAQPWDQVGVPQRLELLRRVGGRMAASDGRIKKTLLQFHDGQSRVLLANSDGVLLSDLRPRTSLFASCVAEQDGRRESNYRDITTRAGLEVYTPALLDELAGGAVKRTLELFDARPLMAGEMPCVLAPGSAGILLHEAIGHGLEADFNRRRVSTYAERLGQRIAGEQVTVVDDGTIPHAHGAINFDDEGGQSQRTVLVEKGVLRSYLHDRLSARWYKCDSTGSGRRQSFEYAPMPRMRATFMEAGPFEPAEIIASVKKGLYAVQFTNGQVNIGAGDFSFYVKSGYAIENGKLTHPVKDVNIIGNGPQALSRISMVGNDPALATAGYMCGKLGQTVPVSQGLPTTLVSAINVGGTHG